MIMRRTMEARFAEVVLRWPRRGVTLVYQMFRSSTSVAPLALARNSASTTMRAYSAPLDLTVTSGVPVSTSLCASP